MQSHLQNTNRELQAVGFNDSVFSASRSTARKVELALDAKISSGI
jgi:hypothetical protein